jgi:hypothetical protein
MVFLLQEQISETWALSKRNRPSEIGKLWTENYFRIFRNGIKTLKMKKYCE